MKTKFWVKYLVGHFRHPLDKTKEPKQWYKKHTATIIAEDQDDVVWQLRNKHSDMKTENNGNYSTAFMKILTIYNLS